MEDQLTRWPPENELARWTELEEAVRQYARASKAPNTVRAYRSDLGDFTMWCTDHQLTPIPATPETVALYITALAGTGARPSTIQRRLSAISQAHQLSGHEPSPTQSPIVRTTMAGIRRTLGMAPAQKAAVVTAELRTLLGVTPADTLAGLRDRALLLVGFAGGFRRGELVALDVEDVEETEEGLRVRVQRSRRHRWRAALPSREPPRPDTGPPADRRGGRPGGEARCRARGTRSNTICGPLPALRAGNGGRRGRCPGAGDHETDGASVRRDGAALHPRGITVPGERGRLRRTVASVRYRSTEEFQAEQYSTIDARAGRRSQDSSRTAQARRPRTISAPVRR